MSDTDSDSDDLGLFSFANKKKIVTKAPTNISTDQSIDLNEPKNKNLFRKRKRYNPPAIIMQCSNDTGSTAAEAATSAQVNGNNLDDSLLEEESSLNTSTENKERLMYDIIVDNICKVDDIEKIQNCEPVKTTKKFKQSAEKRMRLASNLDGVLNRLKSNMQPDLPELTPLVTVPEEARPFLLKMKKGSNIHRFKIKYDTPLSLVLEHLTPIYGTTPNHIIMQLKDEQIDHCKTPQQLSLTVADIIEVLISSEPNQESNQEETVEVVDNVNIITIKIQSTEHRNNTREYQVIKDKPLTEYLFKACQDFNYGAAKYFFDGDPIDPRKSPNDLDIEDLDCIDIVQQT